MQTEPNRENLNQATDNQSQQEAASAAPQEKTRIYNLIILDKSGSMRSIEKAACDGCNEVLGGIRASAEKNAAEQEQFVSLLLFDSDSMPYIYRLTPAAETTELPSEKYRPCACTPLLDAMGMALTDLEQETDRYRDAVGMVTVITDGYENASREFTYRSIRELVGKLKQKGWNFAFMGANQDVSKVCADLNFNEGNAVSFAYSEEGMRDTMRRDRMAKERYYERMRQCKMSAPVNASKEEMSIRYCLMNTEERYFIDDFMQHKLPSPTPEEIAARTTPDFVGTLQPDEIFVFGSNPSGEHRGGASAIAYQRFGAVWGQAEGLQGQSYAIVTLESRRRLVRSVHDFIEYARQHPEKRFLVTRIACGMAGYTPEQVAPLFAGAISLANVCLPAAFWRKLRNGHSSSNL